MGKDKIRIIGNPSIGKDLASKLPSRKQIEEQLLFLEIEKWSKKYLISFQFWGEANMNFYIAKEDVLNDLEVDLHSGGGYDTVNEVLKAALDWIYKVNKTPYSKRVV